MHEMSSRDSLTKELQQFATSRILFHSDESPCAAPLTLAHAAVKCTPATLALLPVSSSPPHNVNLC